MKNYREILSELEQQGYVIDNLIGLVEVIQNTITYAPTDKRECIGALDILSNTLQEHLEKLNDIRQKTLNIKNDDSKIVAINYDTNLEVRAE